MEVLLVGPSRSMLATSQAGTRLKKRVFNLKCITWQAMLATSQVGA